MVYSGIDVLHAGIATHFVPADKLETLTEALLAPGSRNTNEILNEFQPKNLRNDFSLAPQMDRIDKFFSGDSVETIISGYFTFSFGFLDTILCQ